MASTFPGQEDVFVPFPYIDGTDYVKAAYAIAWVNAILAIESTIGTGSPNTAGDPLYSVAYGQQYTTLTQRISAIEVATTGGVAINPASGNIKPVGSSAQAGDLGTAADAEHVHQGVTSFSSGYGFSISEGDGEGHGALTGSIVLGYEYDVQSNFYDVTISSESFMSISLVAGTWIVFFSGLVGSNVAASISCILQLLGSGMTIFGGITSLSVNSSTNTPVAFSIAALVIVGTPGTLNGEAVSATTGPVITFGFMLGLRAG